MHLTKSAFAATVLASFATAKPVESSSAKPSPSSPSSQASQTPSVNAQFRKTISVKQVYVGQVAKPAPAIAMLNTYAKFNKNPPSRVKSAAKTAQQTGSVQANPEAYDEAYLCPVSVGGQTLNLDFDTGSSDFWVYSSLLPSTAQAGRSVYNPNSSANSSLMSGQSWSISYGDGSGASGKVYADTVQIGSVTATKQAVEAATSVSSQFLSDTSSGGLVGLAFSNLNTVRPNQQTTFFDTVKSSLAAPLFTAKLIKGGPGSYDFGFIDPSKYVGPITYAPIVYSTGFWQFNVGGYKIQGQPRNFQSVGSAIADTGTTLLYLPQSLVDNYWSQVQGAYNSNQFGGYIFPCSANLPSLSLGIRGTLFQIVSTTNYFTIPGYIINYAPVSNTMCFGGLQSNSGIGFSILGDIFLKSVFTVFDQTQAAPRIGFARPT